MKQPIPETAEGYLARAKAVFKLAREGGCNWTLDNGNACRAVHEGTLGEFLHAADMEGI